MQLIGEQIGHYRLQKMLGQGGMGVVYLAEDQSVSRQVALKMIPADTLFLPNSIAVVAEGNVLDFYVNRQYIDSVPDSISGQVSIALVADAQLQYSTTEVAYSKAKIWTGATG